MIFYRSLTKLLSFLCNANFHLKISVLKLPFASAWLLQVPFDNSLLCLNQLALLAWRQLSFLAWKYFTTHFAVHSCTLLWNEFLPGIFLAYFYACSSIEYSCPTLYTRPFQSFNSDFRVIPNFPSKGTGSGIIVLGTAHIDRILRIISEDRAARDIQVTSSFQTLQLSSTLLFFPNTLGQL